MGSLPRDLEVPSHVVVAPGSGDRAIVQAEILPLSGCPSCAKAATTAAKEAKMQNIRRVLAPINPPDEWSFEVRMLAPVEKNQNTVLN